MGALFDRAEDRVDFAAVRVAPRRDDRLAEREEAGREDDVRRVVERARPRL